MKNIIFFAGIHGVGKNFMLNNIKFSQPIIRLSASEVLKWNEINANPNDKKVSSISKTWICLHLNSLFPINAFSFP